MQLGTALPAPVTAARVRLNRTVIESTITAALGGLLFGFYTAVVSGITRALTDRCIFGCIAGFGDLGLHQRGFS
jgi:hypothetical protein